jgi:hypothetical protein
LEHLKLLAFGGLKLGHELGRAKNKMLLVSDHQKQEAFHAQEFDYELGKVEIFFLLL